MAGQTAVQGERELMMDAEKQKMIEKIAGTIRGLSIDGVQKANSGHPGLPLGCADLAAYLYATVLRQDPADPKWLNRDYFCLSAGHGSMLLYSCLHLAGYDLPLEELKHFRQLHSKTPGHPESLMTPGVEVTTGPLGQGFGNAVGIALGLKLLANKFNTKEHTLFDNKVYCLAGDGCIMEGVTSEVSSFAGHLRLDNLVVFYDCNKICLDGPTSECLSENTKMRYKAYGWDVYDIDGHNLEEIHHTLQEIRQKQERPVLVVTHTIIGKGSPNKAGTHKVHGSPLGPEEAALTKEALGLPAEEFYIPKSVSAFFQQHRKEQGEEHRRWEEQLRQWRRANPELSEKFDQMRNKTQPKNLEEQLKSIEMKSPIAGRQASQIVLQRLAELLPFLYGGSADLSCSDLTMLQNYPVVAPGLFNGRNIKFGVREFGMATIATGLAHTGMITPYVGTFLTFSDYMRNAIRLAALSRTQVIYQFTHDSVFLGEDGPTHQPVEQVSSLRAMPDLQVIRPADEHEVEMAWLAALRYDGPTALCLSRQSLPALECTNVSYADGVGRGAYIVRREKRQPDFTLIATGSELSLALDVADELERRDKAVRVISMPCWEIFERQPAEYRREVMCGELGKRVSIEAGVDHGWHRYIGPQGIAICVEGFGLSAPASAIAPELGFTVDGILEQLLSE